MTKLRKPFFTIRSLAIYLLVLIIISLYYLLFHSSLGPSALQYSYSSSKRVFDRYYDLLNSNNSRRHAIDDLILKAGRAHDLLLRERSWHVKSAAARCKYYILLDVRVCIASIEASIRYVEKCHTNLFFAHQIVLEEVDIPRLALIVGSNMLQNMMPSSLKSSSTA